MSEIKFKATVSSIVEFEKNTGRSIMTAFSDNMSVTLVVELVKACSNATDEMIDSYVAEHGLEALMNELVQALVDSGFLPKDTAPTATK